MKDWKKWAKAAGVRAIKTMAQTAVAVIGTGAVISTVDWKMAVSSAVRGRITRAEDRGRVIALLYFAPTQPAGRELYEDFENY